MLRAAVVLLIGVVVLPVAFGPQQVSAALPGIYAGGVLAHTNAQRYLEGLHILESDTTLSQVAYTKMQDLFARQYFAHEAPTGESVGDLATDAGYAYISVGENLALGDFSSNKDVVEAWMDSPGHRANILSETYTDIGIAAGRGRYEGRTTWVVVQAFGLPRSSCPGVDANLGARIDSLQSRLDLLERIVTIRRDATEERGITRSEYNRRVASYNTAAELYNNTVERYRSYAESYNAGVDEVNSCIINKVN